MKCLTHFGLSDLSQSLFAPKCQTRESITTFIFRWVIDYSVEIFQIEIPVKV